MNLLIVSLILTIALCRWSPERAKEWYAKLPWLHGANFIPSTASNELEMWQGESFDLVTIDRELGWAEKLGFNSMRVYLHYLLWSHDKEGLFVRMDKFLTLADKYKISIMFVLLDDCWNGYPKIGKQPDPIPHVHNSRWLQSPGVAISRDITKHGLLEGYIKDTIRRFANDKRVVAWDLYNEPGNNAHPDATAKPMLEKAFKWAREVNPSQPLFAAVWTGEWGDPNKLSPLNKVMLEESDVIVFHAYNNINAFKDRHNQLKQYNRPIICNEYMARPFGSTFKDIMPYMKTNKIGAYNWGFVSGRSQTIYPWDSWQKNYTEEPKVWFHDILRQDGTPFDKAEVKLIQSLK